MTEADADREASFHTGSQSKPDGYGTLTITEDGTWKDVRNDKDLVAGETKEVVTVTSKVGTPVDITITLNGLDDAATFGGDQAASITETNGDDETEKVSGTLTVAGADS